MGSVPFTPALIFIAMLVSASAWGQIPMQKEMQMMKASENQASFIDRFSRKSKERDLDGVYAMLDSVSLSGGNPDDIKAYLQNIVFPFFADFEKLHNYKQITNATLPDGRVGLWHYTYIVTASGKILPFRIAVIDGDDGTKVLHIDVNKCIAGRHPSCSL